MDSSEKHVNVNPKLIANPVSKLLFWWMFDLFRKGLDRDLGVEDLYNVLPEDKSQPLTDQLERNWQAELRRAAANSDGAAPSLLRAMVKTFGASYSLLGAFVGFNTIVLRVMQPLLLGLLLQHFEADSQTTAVEARWYAAGLITCGLLSVAFHHHSWVAAHGVGMRVRIAVCSLVYRKVLTSSQTALGGHSAGAMANLLGNDAARFDMVFLFLHHVWILPVQTIIVTFIIFRLVGVAAFVGVACLFFQTVPVQSYLSRLASRYRRLMASRTDDRVRIMGEIVSGIQAIKMYAWEKPFEAMAALARRHEVAVLSKAAYLKAIYLSFMVFSERTSLFVTLVTCAMLEGHIPPGKVFALAQFFNVLQLTMAITYPQAILQAAETRVSISRLQDVLMLAEHVALEDGSQPDPLGSTTTAPGGVYMRNAIACWSRRTITPTLGRLNIIVKPGQLCALVGPVGSGKSSLLQALLGELPLSAGTLSVGGRVSYASQEPWLFSGTVRANILLGLPWDAHRYRHVIRACALEPDLDALPGGDHTLVGERGAGLSGGQRARISLARAVYREADIYLLDDPLSAVDTHVGRHLFKDCITGFLLGKTVILATHQLHFLHSADLIVILNNGTVENQGTYSELQIAATHFSTALSSDDGETTPHVEKAPRRTSVSSAHSSMGDSMEDDDDDGLPRKGAVGEVTSSGNVRWALYADYFKAGASGLTLAAMVLLLIAGQAASSGADYWVTFWTNQEELRHYYSDLAVERATNGTLVLESMFLDNMTLGGDTAIANVTVTDTPSGDMLMGQREGGGIDYGLNLTLGRSLHLEDDGSITDLLPTATCIWVYAGFILGSIVLTTARSFWFMSICMRASRRLHDAMFAGVVRATMFFFDTNPSGRVLNRFSKDMGAVDEILPRAFLESIQVFLVMAGILVMVLLVSPWFLVPMFIIGMFFSYVRKIYLASAQDLKRLDGIMRSPVLSHVSATLDGLSTVRACNAQALLRAEMDALQDAHTAAYDLGIAGSAAFGFWLDLLSATFVSSVTISFLVMPLGSLAGASVGLAISQSLVLTGMLQHGIRQTAEVVAQMTSVERVVDYTELDQEGPFKPLPGKAPARNWPHFGEIHFDHLSLTYVPGEPPSLRDLHFKVKPGHKVGVVGRTGAGKSSLVAALFRLAPTQGRVWLDNLDTAEVGLVALRTRLSIIPQTPALFAGTLRTNLDPTGTKHDHALWEAVREVELHEALTGLDDIILEGGANLSAGQRQLVCLARAIVRDNRVLVLDEATANVDPQTDALIQATIRRRFAECTVITIAHRLHTVMDSDRILVMDAGAVAEYGAPHLLLQNPDGFLSRMVAETGTAMNEKLHLVARQAYVEEEASTNS